MPDDLQLRFQEAVRRIAERECDVVLFTTSIQLTHLLDVAASMGKAAEVRRALAEDVAIGSVGPVMDTALADCGLTRRISRRRIRKDGESGPVYRRNRGSRSIAEARRPGAPAYLTKTLEEEKFAPPKLCRGA